jgi:serine/threonine-protein kinase PknG
VLEILPAFQYLHDLGLVYCDFKPDNVIQVGDAVKLIDLGGVRRIDDADSAIYGTVGYQAPEVARSGRRWPRTSTPSAAPCVVLAMEFRGYQSTYVSSLPPLADTPLFQEYDSFYRLLLKACAPDPADRFASADELRVQLLGVLREVVAQHRCGRALDVVVALRRPHRGR